MNAIKFSRSWPEFNLALLLFSCLPISGLCKECSYNVRSSAQGAEPLHQLIHCSLSWSICSASLPHYCWELYQSNRKFLITAIQCNGVTGDGPLAAPDTSLMKQRHTSSAVIDRIHLFFSFHLDERKNPTAQTNPPVTLHVSLLKLFDKQCRNKNKISFVNLFCGD